MAKCPSCGVEHQSGAKFCTECGAPIPQTKECPQCHVQLSLSVKFCSECGYSFAGSSSSASPTSGMTIGDKNTIAGDVVGHQENMKILGGNVTINKHEDQTKRVVKCHICGKNVKIADSFDCPSCHQTVCDDCYDRDNGCCSKCTAERIDAVEGEYWAAVEKVLEDGRIDADEHQQLERLRKKLGLTNSRAMEIQTQMKSELLERKRSQKADMPLKGVEEAQFNRATELYFNDGDGQEAVRLLESIRKAHPLNEKVLSTYLAALASYDTDAAIVAIKGLQVDIPRSYLVRFDIALKNGDLAAAEGEIAAAKELWPDDVLVQCRNIQLMCETARKMDDQMYLAEASDLLTSLPKPKDKLENSWHYLLQRMISEQLGDVLEEVTRQYCKDSNLYYALVTRKVVADEGETQNGDNEEDSETEIYEDEETETEQTHRHKYTITITGKRCIIGRENFPSPASFEDLVDRNGAEYEDPQTLDEVWDGIVFDMEDDKFRVDVRDEQSDAVVDDVVGGGASCPLEQSEIDFTESNLVLWIQWIQRKRDTYCSRKGTIWLDAGENFDIDKLKLSCVQTGDGNHDGWYTIITKISYQGEDIKLENEYSYENIGDVDISDFDMMSFLETKYRYYTAYDKRTMGACCSMDNSCQEAYRAKEYVKAFKYAELGDLFGDRYCQRMLGYMYKDGEGVKVDIEKSLKYFKKAAENGDVKAAFQLGYMYSQGEEVGQDVEESIKWYTKAALSGDKTAQYNLGLHYEKGRGVRKDVTEAIVWYRKAADQGLDSAIKRLHSLGVDFDKY